MHCPKLRLVAIARFNTAGFVGLRLAKQEVKDSFRNQNLLELKTKLLCSFDSLQAIQAMYASDACTGPRHQYGCDRNITQTSYVIRAHRQNFGTSNFFNCETAMVRRQQML